MRILLTNDDGIEAPGLEALFRTVDRTFDAAEIIVVAPDRGRSECGHSVTTTRPLQFQQLKTGWFSVDGTPVDCVRAALARLTSEFDMVLSGVNAGANLGVDLLVSGTFAAAREAAIEGIAAMAVSHYRRPDVPVTWDHVPDWLSTTLDRFAADAQQRSAAGKRDVISQEVRVDQTMLWNVNLPAIDPTAPPPSPIRCAVDRRPMVRTANGEGDRLHFQSDFHSRPREEGSDVERCFAGQLTISEVSPYCLGSNGDDGAAQH